MEDFKVVSEGAIFTMEYPKDKYDDELEVSPHWFNKFGSRSIASWIVSHFSVRILKLYDK
jgi:hypothetical protein